MKSLIKIEKINNDDSSKNNHSLSKKTIWKIMIVPLLVLILGVSCMTIPKAQSMTVGISLFSKIKDIYESGKKIVEIGDSIQDYCNNEFDSDESLISPITSSAAEIMQVVAVNLINATVDCTINVFEPGFFAISKVVNGEKIGVGAITKSKDVSKESVLQIGQLMSLLNASRLIGLIICNILMMFTLFLFICGKAEQIKISLWSLVLRYIISMVAIYNAFNFIWDFLEFIRQIWSKVMSTSAGTITGQHFLSAQGLFLKLFPDVQATILGPIALLSFIFVWKLIKGFFKLFLIIIEKYFCLLILLLLFPAFLPFCLTPDTANITKSYSRMILSQFFVMMFSVLLMKLFIGISISGGWTAGVINYLIALAYLKFATGIDAYFARMGFDIVTGAGQFVRESGGVMRTVMTGIRMAQMGGRTITNIGHQMGQQEASTGINTNNFDLYNKGVERLGDTRSAEQRQIDFTAAISKRNTYSQGINGYTERSSNGESAWAKSTKNGNLSTTYATQFKNAGYDVNSFNSIVQKEDGMFEFYKGDRCEATARNGKVYFNTPDDPNTYKYQDESTEKFKYHSQAGGTNHGYMNEQKICEIVPDANCVIESNRSSFGHIQEGSQQFTVDCSMDENGTSVKQTRNVVVSKVGSGSRDEVNKNYTYASSYYQSKSGEVYRVGYSPIIKSKESRENHSEK